VTRLPPHPVGSLGSYKRWREGEVRGGVRIHCGCSPRDVELGGNPQRLISQPNALGSTRNQHQKKALGEFFNLSYYCIYRWCVAGSASSCEGLEAVSRSKNLQLQRRPSA
jgi:hypothetical protein